MEMRRVAAETIVRWPVRSWFGPPWGAWVCEATPEMPVPVGQPCCLCPEPIRERDQGVYRYDPWEQTVRPCHLVCHLAGPTV